MNSHKTIALAVLFAFSLVAPVQATPVIDFTGDNSDFTWFGNNLGCEQGCTLGYSFNVSAAITIDGLGIFDADADGLNDSHGVALWRDDGTLVASTTVLAGTIGSDASASGVGGYAYADISSLMLGSGDYVIGALYAVGTSDRVVFSADGIFSNDPNVSYIEGRFINSGILELPTGGAGSDRYFGPALRIASIDVPEPGVFALLGLGLLGLGLSRRRAHA